MIKNITAWPVTVKSGERIAKVEPANAVPNMLAPKLQEDGVPVVHKSAEVRLEVDQQGSDHKQQPRGSGKEPKKNQAGVDRTPLSAEQIEMLLTKIDFKEGTKDWSEDQREKARAVLTKYSFLFAMDTMDLGKTDLVKHHIELTNYTPIKDRYRRIPPQQYEEV